MHYRHIEGSLVGEAVSHIHAPQAVSARRRALRGQQVCVWLRLVQDGQCPLLTLIIAIPPSLEKGNILFASVLRSCYSCSTTVAVAGPRRCKCVCVLVLAAIFLSVHWRSCILQVVLRQISTAKPGAHPFRHTSTVVLPRSAIGGCVLEPLLVSHVAFRGLYSQALSDKSMVARSLTWARVRALAVP